LLAIGIGPETLGKIGFVPFTYGPIWSPDFARRSPAGAFSANKKDNPEAFALRVVW